MWGYIETDDLGLKKWGFEDVEENQDSNYYHNTGA